MAGNADNMMRADSAASFAASTVEALRRDGAPRTLSPLARAVAAEPVAQAMSPVIIAGVVRAYEFAAIVIAGTAIYRLHVDPKASALQYVLAAFGRCVRRRRGVSDLQSLQHVGIPRADLSADPHRYRHGPALFLVGFAIAFFAKFETSFSRVWAGSFYVTGLLVLCAGRIVLDRAGAALGARRPPGAPRRHRRRRRRRRSADRGAAGGHGFRSAHLRRVRRSQRRPLAAGCRRHPQARHRSTIWSNSPG